MVAWLEEGYTQAIVFPMFDTANLNETVGYQKIPIFEGDKRFANKDTNGKAAVFFLW